ncbi:hypothetical protein PMZ80_006920 [Knufia obscura]|uniref:Autophagy-related protein 14 n=2 Tax=Knufia TaxID=430999 RepID=A0AAN8EN99_9EURO|nr:hypothetical protein PMZ80_006920 [Knufia obscura]KAK5957460.1 hypothetical protein OHC33_001835 [Knufia fluminis]
MDCDICLKPSGESVDFLCTNCARSAAYVPRLEYARMLLERDAAKSSVERAVRTETQGPSDVTTPSQDEIIWQQECKQVHASESKRRMNQIGHQKESLKHESEELKAQIEELKARIVEKKQMLGTVEKKVPHRWEEDLIKITTASRKASSSILQIQQKSVGSRATLCREAASLMRLRQRRRQRDAPGREQYSIAGLTLPDLREISNVRCADLTAVLGSVAHLVLLVAFYLGIRLPAEITLPSRIHPMPTVTAPFASYRGRLPDALGSVSAMSVPSSPSASRHETGASVRPRPLFIGSENRDERIFNFQKNEPQAFNMFVEGLALLAWDVAWLCRSQGFTTGTNSWEEICNIGKNLHQLLIANPQAPSIARMQSDRLIQKRPGQIRQSSSPLHDTRKEAAGKLGQASDVSAPSQLPRTSRSENFRSWVFLSWQAVALSLRKTLLTEITSAEWELLQDQEWDDGGEQFDEAVFVKTRTLDGQQYDDARSIMTTRTRLDEESLSARTPGTSGWTKLKSREQP